MGKDFWPGAASFRLHPYAHRQPKNLPSLEKCLVEAVNHAGAMVPGDGQMKRVAGPQPGFEMTQILLGQTEIAGVWQEDREGLVHHHLEPGVGPCGRVGIQPTHANFPGDQRGELDSGPMTDGKLPSRQLTDKRRDLVAGRLRKNEWRQEAGIEIEHSPCPPYSLSSRA